MGCMEPKPQITFPLESDPPQTRVEHKLHWTTSGPHIEARANQPPITILRLQKRVVGVGTVEIFDNSGSGRGASVGWRRRVYAPRGVGRGEGGRGGGEEAPTVQKPKGVGRVGPTGILLPTSCGPTSRLRPRVVTQNGPLPTRFVLPSALSWTAIPSIRYSLQFCSLFSSFSFHKFCFLVTGISNSTSILNYLMTWPIILLNLN